MENKDLMVVNNELAASASAAMAKAEVEAAYIMALKKPRSWNEARAKLLDACKRPSFAEKAEYKKPIGGGQIKGASIRLLEAAIQAAGNVRTTTTVLYEDESIRKIRVDVVDLENNTGYNKEITLQKTVERSRVREGQEVLGERTNSSGKTVYIIRATEDELLVKQGAAESKIIRTLAQRLIPADIIEDALEVAKKTRMEGKDPIADRNKVIDAFSSIGIKPSDLEKYLAKSVAQMLPRDIDDLRNVYTAIKDGEAKWSDFVEDAEVVEKSFDEKLKEAKKANETKAEDAEVVLTPLQTVYKLIEDAKMGKVVAEKSIKTLIDDKSDTPLAQLLESLNDAKLADVIKGLEGIVAAKNKK